MLKIKYWFAYNSYKIVTVIFMICIILKTSYHILEYNSKIIDFCFFLSIGLFGGYYVSVEASKILKQKIKNKDKEEEPFKLN